MLTCFFIVQKKKLEGSYLHVIQLELHILLTINAWKKWIDFVKNKFHLNENIEWHCMQLHWIEFQLNFNSTKFNLNSIKDKSFKINKIQLTGKFGQKNPPYGFFVPYSIWPKYHFEQIVLILIVLTRFFGWVFY
jgi:hypothetical protein